jgi:alkylhydroperoxidase/carboxymuconolactone decarboxylase family protein YurZ
MKQSRRDTIKRVATAAKAGDSRTSRSRRRAWPAMAARYPDVASAYEALSECVRAAGPLDARDVALVKVSISIGRGSWRSIHAHTRKALEARVDPDALRQVALIALPVAGLAAALDAYRWIDEIIRETQTSGDDRTRRSRRTSGTRSRKT